jgi:hypothetical protein
VVAWKHSSHQKILQNKTRKKIMGDRAPQQHLLALSDEEIVAPEEVIESALTVLLYEHRHW